ncbi:MAG: Gfo/Idh/MocA family oxidoreductase [Edaphobacter sp.]|uniref:Gfo/Idh/MocA family protein n=1 Tax=Edaphobacter sp. TaxID=1934404 RepID=UPI0023955C47|nr:Gfo/Idh/MocA family oxidoreductase [Edaphobacter sp.]MDE1175823.1 Gfo/Idh/MocA family oxidoreductase [Edaphobacter sp.]
MKFALLGYGFMGGAHLAALQRIEGVTVKAVASRTRPSNDGPTRGNLDLASGPLPDDVLWTPDWQAVLADPEIDAVDICLPTDMHRETVLAAFAAGKHVLCEKPMALTLSDCEDLMAAAAQSRRVFMVGQVLRFMYPYRYAAQFLGEAGRDNVQRCTLRRSTGYPQWGGWLTQSERSGGAILDLLSHDIDQALSLFGPPVSLQADSVGPVDTMRGVLRYGAGTEVVVEGGWFSSETPFSASFEIEAAGERLDYRDNLMTRTNRHGETTTVAIPEHDPYFDEIAYFVDCCRNNQAPARCLPAESALAVELSLQLKASRDAGGRELKWQR